MNSPTSPLIHPIATPGMGPLWSYSLKNDATLGIRTRKHHEAQLVVTILRDSEFRERFMRSPIAELELQGVSIGGGITYTVIQETDTSACIVLPSNPYEEMTEGNLQSMAGLSYEDLATTLLSRHAESRLGGQEPAARITAKSWRDPAFRAMLRSDPKQVLWSELGMDIPADLSLRVELETANELFLVIPPISRHLSYLDSMSIKEETVEIADLPDHVSLICTRTIVICTITRGA